ncbi:MAG: hypothetical protein AAF961_19060, partial [Planctomycetota bacterium]
MDLLGGDFRLNGVPVAGLESVGDSVPLDIPDGSTFSGTLADGTPFAIYNAKAIPDFIADVVDDGALTLTAADTPTIDTETIMLPGDSVPRGIRNGQTLILEDGGQLGDNFTAIEGSAVHIRGGFVGERLQAAGAEVTVSGGEVGRLLDVMHGSSLTLTGGGVVGVRTFEGGRLSISDGEINVVELMSGGVVDITGGEVGTLMTLVMAENGVPPLERATINISGGVLGARGLDFTGATVNISGGTVGGAIPIGEGTLSISGGTIGGIIAGSFRTEPTAETTPVVNFSGGLVLRRIDIATATANISGGEIDGRTTVFAEGVLNFSGGLFSGSVDIAGEANISGGTFGDEFRAADGGEI